jgi:hypothetical protein
MMAEAEDGSDWYRLSAVELSVYPASDLIIYDDAPGDEWTVEVTRGESDLASTAFSRTGSCSHAIGGAGVVALNYVCQDPGGIDLFGYSHLEFWVNGGDGSGQNPTIAGKRPSDLGIVLEADTWTKASIPVSELPTPFSSIKIGGWVQGTFYLDDMKLVAEEMPTAVEEVAQAAAVPAGYALSQNYPNPFNPVTSIRYDLRQAGDVRLSVYDVLGQMVRTLVDGHRSPGTYSAVWDGKDAIGGEAASGVYFVRLQAGDFHAVSKMALVR